MSLLLKTHSVNNNVLQCLYLGDGRMGMRDLSEMANFKKIKVLKVLRRWYTVESLLKILKFFLSQF